MDKMKQLEKKINVQKVIQSELSQLKSTSKVYRKERSSDIFFLSTLEHEMKISKSTLDRLQEEYTAMDPENEKMSQ